MPMNKPKVFCVGFHKTGTTSIGKAMELIGLKNIHGAGLIRSAVGDTRMMELLFREDYELFFKLAEEYDTFNDNPWFKIYKALDHRFPNSKFILTLREEKEWYESAVRYFGESSSAMRLWLYGKGNPNENRDRFVNVYRKHNLEVQNYFARRPTDLLALSLNETDKMNKITKFLGMPENGIVFPHYNKSHDH
jgi:hypothetical protein